MEISIKWQDTKTGAWNEFNIADIWKMSRTHAINLFSHKVPVIAKQKDTYIVNSKLLFKQYQHNRKTVKMFSDLVPDERALCVMGLI